MMRIVLLTLTVCVCTFGTFADEVHTLATQGKLNELKALIEKDPTLLNKPNEADKGRTPIFCALYLGQLEVLKYLIEAGADVNYRDKDGASPLTLRCFPENMKLLLKAGATINVVPHTQMAAPPLLQAVRSGNTELVQLLLSQGADIGIRGYADGNAALHIVAGMEDGSNIDPTTGRWKSGFGMIRSDTGLAYWIPVADMISLLLDKKANVESRNALGQTPLWKAIEHGSLKHARVLLARGAKLSAIDGSGNPLLFAAHAPETLDFLVDELKINPDTPNVLTGMTYLQSLRAREDRRDIKMQASLKAHGATDDGSGIPETFRKQIAANDVFMDAVCADSVEVVAKMLKETSTLINAYTRRGHTWLERGNTPLHEAKSNAMVELLIKAGSDVNRQNIGGYTPLHLAAQRGDLEKARLLLQRKANPNARTLNFETPLHVAIFSKKPEMIALLLQYKADPRLRNHSQQNPLEKLQSLQPPIPEMIPLLQSATN